MKKFTVKDFITYNNPCFSCGEHISVKFGSITEGMDGWSLLRPQILPESTEVTLKVGYSNHLQFKVFHKSNKIIASSISDLTTYLSGHKLFLTSQCNACGTYINSQHLEFDLDRGFVKPVGISLENLVLSDKGNKYSVGTSFWENSSVAYITKFGSQPIRVEFQFYPLYKFKTREKLLSKLKTYALFS